MDFAYSPKVIDLQARLTRFIQDYIIPAEVSAEKYHEANPGVWGPPPVMADLKNEAKKQGLWNLFLPEDNRGAGLSNLEYSPLAELTGWSPFLAPEAVNCSPPDTGNMELLSRYGTPAQQDQWLKPLLAGDIRSCFSMTEPDVASSDANNISLSVRDDGDNWVINGTKWWSTAAMRPDCKVALVMGVTDPDAAIGKRHSIILVPFDAAGLTLVRSLTVFGFKDLQEGGHAEVRFENVTVPKENILGERGAGFSVAQARLGPGRIHHCMRLIGMAERAIAMMTARAKTRAPFGVLLADQGVVQTWVADARTQVNAARLLVLQAAWRMDVEGNKAARHDIAAAKIMVPQVVKDVTDRAMQVFGGAGVSSDTMLSVLYAQARFLQIADGPDEVHRRSLARAEFASAPLIRVI